MNGAKFFLVLGKAFAIVGIAIAFIAAGVLTHREWQEWQTSELWRLSEKPSSPMRVSLKAPLPAPPVLPSNYTVFALCYHDFREPNTKWSIPPKRLEAQLQMLRAMGFTFLTMSEAVALLSGKWRGPVPKRAVVLTVDDGFRSAYTVLFPLLRRYKAKATLFVYTSWLGKTSNALTWEQLREMTQSGLVEIASHTVTHPYPRRLRKLPDAQYRQRMWKEFVQSKQELEQRLGVRIAGLAYPGGYVDETLKELAKRAGYQWAVVVNPQPIRITSDRYALPRYGVSAQTSVAVLKAWVTKTPVRMASHRKQVPRFALRHHRRTVSRNFWRRHRFAFSEILHR